MLRKIEAAALSVFACFAFASAAQIQGLRIVSDSSAAGVRASGDTIRLEWVQLSGAGSQTPVAEPAVGDVFYAAVPAAGDLAKYTKLASALDANVSAPFGAAKKRVTRFVPGRQGGRMGPGVYHVIAASVTEGGDTLYSDYLTLMVANSVSPELISPRADVMKGESVKKVTELAPIFAWNSVPGVPYYHVVLSDVPFFDDKGKFNEDANVIWQAITPNTRITYGAPDPSKTNTVAPPPLSRGTTYSWMVLNNYGNYPAFTSWDVVNAMNGLAGRFVIDAGGLTAPTPVAPGAGSVFNDEALIELKWNNLDGGANSYLVNLFREGRTGEFGMGGMGDFTMNMLVWETIVPRGAGDELSVAIDAAGTLTGGSYKWRVYALDGRGAASTDSAASVSTFKYNKSSEGALNIKTVETIGGVDLPVGFVELRSEVMSGPSMAPVLFHTNGAGVLDRRFSAGTYRVTTVKEGYPAYTSVVTVAAGQTTSLRINMVRSEAVLYGKVFEAATGLAVSAATVTAVSEWGDTVSAATDGGGGFVLACRAADWTVTAGKPGFGTTSPRMATLRLGDNRDFGSVYLTRNPAALSGVVRNSAGEPLVAARVRVLREGLLVDELASTPQNGAYVFYLNPGAYTVTAEKPGFAMFSRSVAVTGTMTQNISLKEGAVLVSGVITGRSWVANTGAYVDAPIASARVAFAETGVAKPDTFTVTGDPVFGKFSASLPVDRAYEVTVAAAGFGPSGAARRFTTEGAGGEMSKAYSDTLYALATIKGRVIDADGVQVDVVVYDGAGQIVASVKSAGGAYEVRNIPDGNLTVAAGAVGYFTRDLYSITITRGRPGTNIKSYDFSMEAGNKALKFDVVDYTGGGTVKVVSPLNRALDFNNAAGVPAALGGMGGGGYVVEAVPEPSSGRLELSYHAFNVPESEAEHTEQIHFPLISRDTVVFNGGEAEIFCPRAVGNLYSPIERIVLYYRSEGSARFDSAVAANVNVEKIRIKPARDGCKLYYYFRVSLKSGDIYGSAKQLHQTDVKPDPKIISRVTVDPGASGGDTLFMPSLYQAVFAFKAFYGDQFLPINGDAGTVAWSILDSKGLSVIPQGITGATYSYFTPDIGQDLTLRASFKPSGGYTMRAGAESAVEFTVRITGKALKSLKVLRKGDAGPILNTDAVGFRVEALDGDGKPVTVSPLWSVYPDSAAGKRMESDGLFTPNRKFVGMARIEAVAGGLTAEYTEPGAAVPGQRVNYALKRNATGSDTAYTLKGMRVIFGAGAVREGANASLQVAVPPLSNYVNKGTENYRMADSIAFDLSYSDIGAVGGDVVLAFDIPVQFRDAVKDGAYEFRVARWFPDSSLRWIPIPLDAAASVPGRVVSARLSPAPAEEPAALSKIRKASARQVSREAELTASARYALVVKTSKTSLALSVSPHPFSPYIVPKREYPQNDKAGTCIKVNVQAPEPFVRSVKVRVHNATGKMVWGVEKLGAQSGDNIFWWNGRTSGGGAAVSEEVWSEDYYERNAGRPICRNGRYYVMVIVTDMEGRQKRAMKPLVLMK